MRETQTSQISDRANKSEGDRCHSDGMKSVELRKQSRWILDLGLTTKEVTGN